MCLFISTHNKTSLVFSRRAWMCGGNDICSAKIHVMCLTPAAFALVTRPTVTESLLFLQGSEIKLVINGHPKKIQVLFVGCQHLLSQSRESLEEKQNTQGKYKTRWDAFSCSSHFLPLYDYDCSSALILLLVCTWSWNSISSLWAVALQTISPLLCYGWWRHLSQRSPFHKLWPAGRQITVTYFTF